jgi:elongation factor Ts
LVAAKGGALIELNCETDFVAKNAEFQKLADEVVSAAAAAKAADVDALKTAPTAAGGATTTVEQAIAELSAKIGEKLELRRVAFLDGTVETYLHKRSADLPPAVGVLVEYVGDDAAAAHAVALQIAALKARYLTRDDVPDDVVASERRIAEETSRAEGKPEQALPKIVEGRLNGFFKDVVLLEQPSVSDSKKTVKALLDEAGVTVTRFVRFEVGQQ